MNRSPSSPRSTAGRVAGLCLLAIAGYYAVWGGEYSVFDLHRIEQRQQEEAARIEIARARTDSLRDLTDRLDRDAATIETVARERFGMIRDGEVLYRFVRIEPDTASATDPAAARP